MPKVVVVVAKDDNGKLWDYVMTEEEEAHCQNMFGTASGWVHKPYAPQNTPQYTPQTKPVEKDDVTFVVLPPTQEKRQRTRRTQTNATTK